MACGPFDTRLIQKEINSTGNTCTIIEVSRSTASDEYREVTETTTEHTGIKCFSQTVSNEDDIAKDGRVRAGDYIFWFDSSQESYCEQGNRITFDSKTLQIYEVKKYDVNDTTYLIECRTRQI